MEQPSMAACIEVEYARALQKKLPLLGKQDRKPRQVDLLRVRFDLREVRVHGYVDVRVLAKAEAHVRAYLPGLLAVRYATYSRALRPRQRVRRHIYRGAWYDSLECDRGRTRRT